MNAPAIEAIGIAKSYGALQVLDGVDLRVERGSVFSLLGPNARLMVRAVVVGARRVDRLESLATSIGARKITISTPKGPHQIWIKRVVAEMGGKDAIVVADDADLDAAVAGVVASAYGFSGQKCSSRHLPGVEFTGITHPGLFGTAPSSAKKKAAGSILLVALMVTVSGPAPTGAPPARKCSRGKSTSRALVARD